MNIILIIVDSLRPDHLSINGYSRETSPNIDQFCQESTSFLNDYCTLTRTYPSIASILTGMYPHIHGIRMIANNKDNLSLSTLPEILGSHGYKTAFIGVGDYTSMIRKGFQEFNPKSWRLKNRLKREMYKIFHPKNPNINNKNKANAIMRRLVFR